ncbi:MAG: hypothetical protein AAGF83_04875 [Cyanobacteria bacterium P01_G01_bin.67]
MININTAKTREANKLFWISPETKEKKHFKVIEKTYQNNTDSDYTEKIEDLARNFNYSSNSKQYWGAVEFSTLYGTPLFEEASHSEKRALNHLYWVGMYNYTSASEVNTMLFNEITAGVFANIGGYETLCNELDFENSQETYHIRAFQRIGYKTKLALLGKSALGNPFQKLTSKNRLGWLSRVETKSLEKLLETEKLSTFQDSTIRNISKFLYSDHDKYLSQYFRKRRNQTLPTTTGGVAGTAWLPSFLKFFTFSWGCSPFLAAQYYSARMIANIYLKGYEYNYHKRFRELGKQEKPIPTPTAISYYHLLDESFHTTMSQVISQEVYKDFAKPTTAEKIIANWIIYSAQRGLLEGLSAAMPSTFRDDSSYMLTTYRLLRSPLFNMSAHESLHWMEKCFCQEHEGFHTNLKHHKRLLSDFRRFFEKLDYLLPVNREMHLMAAGGSISRAIQKNRKDFKKFSMSIELSR